MNSTLAIKLAKEYILHEGIEIQGSGVARRSDKLSGHDGPCWVVEFDFPEDPDADWIDSVSSVLVVVDDMNHTTSIIPGL